MALPAKPRTSSSIAGLPIYWQEATKPPKLERETWIDLFEVALMAKSNISRDFQSLVFFICRDSKKYILHAIMLQYFYPTIYCMTL